MNERTQRIILALVAIACVLALDLSSKAWAWANLRNGESVEVIEGLFYLKFGFNTGAAFSFLRDANWARGFFILITLGALGYMGWLAAKMPTTKWWGFAAVGMIAGGALGNLHDRFVRTMRVPHEGDIVERYGVVDFLQFYYPWDPEHYWPIFNVADSALVVGVLLLLAYIARFGDAEVEVEEKAEDGVSSPDSADIDASPAGA